MTQRGLLHKKPKFFDFFHAGLLNKMYLRMNDVVYHGSGAVRVHYALHLAYPIVIVFRRPQSSIWETMGLSWTWRR